LRPFLPYCSTGLSNVFEVSTAKVFVLLNVEPEIEHILGAFALQEETEKGGKP
jgi:hypothetical protein